MQSAPLGVRDGRDAMTAAMRSAATATTTGELLDAQTAAAAAAARFGLVGRLPFGPIMGLDPLPAASDADDRLADAARRIELLVGYTRNDGAPFVAMDPRIARLKRLGPLGAAVERAAAAALTRRVFSRPARRLARRGAGMAVAPRHFGWTGRHAMRRWGHATASNCRCCSTRPTWADAPMLGGGPVDHRLAETMRRNWSGFAHHGVAGLDSSALRFG